MVEIRSPLQGTLVRIVSVGSPVAAGAEVAVIESMKMEHAIDTTEAGVVTEVLVATGDSVQPGDVLARLAPAPTTGAVPGAAEAPATVVDGASVPAGERADLAEVRARHAIGLDGARPDAVERRRRTGQRTARERSSPRPRTTAVTSSRASSASSTTTPNWMSPTCTRLRIRGTSTAK